MDNLAVKYKLKESKDWGKITKKHFLANSGITLLDKYGRSVFKLLKSVYPGIFNMEYFLMIKMLNGRENGLKSIQKVIGRTWTIKRKF
jgi:hypothetical protein